MEKIRSGIRKRLSGSSFLRKRLGKMGQSPSSPLKQGRDGYEKISLKEDDDSSQESGGEDLEGLEINNKDCVVDSVDDSAKLLPDEKIDSVDGAELKEAEIIVQHGTEENMLSVSMQIFLPFLVAGFGMVAAGLVLDVVQHWTVFETVTELFILVPALLGLKGNLEMTLASRLSTFANLGYLDSKEDALSAIFSNMALIQCQAIVVALLASLFAVTMGWMMEGTFEFDHGLLLCASSLVTASLASFVLGMVMVGVILCSRKLRVNPDNVATPIAASLGDLTTLLLLSWIASVLWGDLHKDKWLAPLIIAFYICLVPFCIYVARKNQHTEKVLYSGWSPVLLAMIISSVGGLILDQAVSKFSGIAVFQPVMNGVGGNLVAVQASRISTHLHMLSTLGTLPESEKKICVNPFSFLCGSGVHCRTSRILIAMVVPGHLIFTYSITFLEAGHTSPTVTFLMLYLIAALIQVWILLHTAHWLIMWFWTLSIDPDNSAIPYLTALGDLLGGGLLWIAFECLYLIGDDGELGY